ncbi:MAG: O-antigen ligase family protein [Clostridiaceae bacterium]
MIYIIWNEDARSRLWNGIKDYKSITTMSLLLITVWTLLSSIWSLSFKDTFGISFLFIFLFLLFLLIKYEYREEGYREGFQYALFIGLFFVMAYLAFQNITTFLHHGMFIRGAHISTIENANSLSVMSMMGFFMAFFKARGSKDWVDRIFYILLTLLCLGAVLSAQSRAALGIMLFGLIVLVVMYNKRILWVLLIFVIIIALMPSVQQRFLDIFSYEQNVPRVKIWLVALKLFQMNPLTGTGASAFRFGYTEYFNTHPDLFNDWDIPGIWHAHNMFLRFLAELGIPGLLGILGTIFGSFKALRGTLKVPYLSFSTKRTLQGIFIALITFTMASLVDSYFMEPKVMIIFYILIGISQSFSEAQGVRS